MCTEMVPMMVGMFFIGGLSFGAGALLVYLLWKKLTGEKRKNNHESIPHS